MIQKGFRLAAVGIGFYVSAGIMVEFSKRGQWPGGEI